MSLCDPRLGSFNASFWTEKGCGASNVRIEESVRFRQIDGLTVRYVIARLRRFAARLANLSAHEVSPFNLLCN
jgi:hypothetical protein